MSGQITVFALILHKQQLQRQEVAVVGDGFNDGHDANLLVVVLVVFCGEEWSNKKHNRVYEKAR